jgi:hypothetical protein
MNKRQKISVVVAFALIVQCSILSVGWTSQPQAGLVYGFFTGSEVSDLANGAQVGGVIGAAAGLVIGGIAGAVVGIPTGPGAVATGAAGAIGGGCAGAAIGAAVGGF